MRLYDSARVIDTTNLTVKMSLLKFSQIVRFLTTIGPALAISFQIFVAEHPPKSAKRSRNQLYRSLVWPTLSKGSPETIQQCYRRVPICAGQIFSRISLF